MQGASSPQLRSYSDPRQCHVGLCLRGTVAWSWPGLPAVVGRLPGDVAVALATQHAPPSRPDW